MSAPSLPTSYDVSKHVPAGRRDCLLTVGFDQHQQHIPRFLVQLYYRVGTDPIEWTAIARMGHNEMSTLGHDVYHEGLHVDVARRSQPTVHLQLADRSLPVSPEGENDAQAVAGAADLVQEALEQDDAETQTKMLRQALVAPDRETEQ